MWLLEVAFNRVFIDSCLIFHKICKKICKTCLWILSLAGFSDFNIFLLGWMVPLELWLCGDFVTNKIITCWYKEKIIEKKRKLLNDECRVIWLFSEKHNLLASTGKEKIGCEIRMFWMSKSSDIIVDDYTSIRKVTRSFTSNCVKIFVLVSYKNNICMNSLTWKVLFFNIPDERSTTIEGKSLKLSDACLKDTTDSIAITTFVELIDKQKNETSYSLTDVIVVNYMLKWLLKRKESFKMTFFQSLNLRSFKEIQRENLINFKISVLVCVHPCLFSNNHIQFLVCT